LVTRNAADYDFTGQLNQHAKRGGGTELNNTSVFSGINVVSISVTDLDKARDFYGTVLGFGDPIYDLPEAGWIEFPTGGSGNLSVVLAEPGWTASTSTTVVLNVEDCASAVATLRNRGVTCDDPQVFPGFVTFASFFDPFGNRLQMCSPAAPAG
jgi:predicted enzyme related to lactoylglutathione lyase